MAELCIAWGVPMSQWWQVSFELPDGGPSFSEIWAEDRRSAEVIAETRGFQGKVKKVSRPVSEFRPSVIAKRYGLGHPDVFHSLCYVSFLAARSGVVSAEQLVADESPLHELSHWVVGGDNMRGGNFGTYVISRMEWLESLVPGIPPHDVHIEAKVGFSYLTVVTEGRA